MQKKQLNRITRSQVKGVTVAMLQRQKGICPLCLEPIDLNVQGHKSSYTLDHNHETGEIRAVLHRSCNGAEGKVLSQVGRWGAGKVSYEAVIPYLERLLAYWKHHQEHGTGLMYPDHKTPEQKHLINLKKRREAAAKQRAVKAMQAKQRG